MKLTRLVAIALGILCLSLQLESAAFASSTGTPGILLAKRSKKSRKSAPSRPDVRPGSSRDNRGDKKYIFLAEMGLIDILHFGVGAEAGYFLSPDTLAEATVFRADFGFLGFTSTVTYVTARYKWFVGNSFYLHFGGGLRTLEAETEGLFTSDFHSKFSASHLAGEFGLGNRWQFSAFTLGCDWVGYGQPLVQISDSETLDESLSEDQKEQDRSDFKSRAERGNLMNVRFHLGMAF